MQETHNIDDIRKLVPLTFYYSIDEKSGEVVQIYIPRFNFISSSPTGESTVFLGGCI